MARRAVETGAVRIGEGSFATKVDFFPDNDDRASGFERGAARRPAGGGRPGVADCLSRADVALSGVSGPRAAPSRRGGAAPRGRGRAPAGRGAGAQRAAAVPRAGAGARGGAVRRSARDTAAAAASSAAGPGGGRARAAARSSPPKLSVSRFGTGASTKGRTEFARAHRSGLPFRLEHKTSGRHALRWDVPVERVDCSRLLPTCAAGLSEVDHPYALLARTALRDILAIRPSAASGPVLGAVMRHVRAALGRAEKECQQAALLALRDLSAAAGQALNEHLGSVLPALSRRSAMGGGRADAVLSLCEVLEANGGRDAASLIKSKIPTYSSVLL